MIRSVAGSAAAAHQLNDHSWRGIGLATHAIQIATSQLSTAARETANTPQSAKM
jgi:hypothetical protein